MEWGPILIAGVPGTLALAAVLLKALVDRRHVEAAATDLIASAAKKAVETVMLELNSTVGNLRECKETLVAQETRIEFLEKANVETNERVVRLRAQVIALGERPVNGG